MAYKQLKAPNLKVTDNPGWCLRLVRAAFGVPGIEPYAKSAWNNAKYRHTGAPPSDVSVPVFWTWTGTIDGINRDWGDVAVHVPGKGVFGTPQRGAGKSNRWDASIAARGAWIGGGAKYLGWTEDLNGTRVVEPITKPSAPAQGGDMTKTQATAFVDTVARISFGKAIDKGGMDNYVGHLLAGRYTPQRVLTEIYNSQQAKDYRAKTYTKTVTKVVEKVVEKPGTGSNADISHIRQVVDKIWALISKVFK